MEHKIIAALISDRESFDRIDQHLGHEDISPEGQIVLKQIRKFYYKDTLAKSADLELLRPMVLRTLQNPKHADIFNSYLGKVAEQDVSAPNIVSELLAMKTEIVKMSLAEAILARNEKLAEELRERWAEIRLDDDLEGSVHEEYQELGGDELLQTFDKDHLIRVMPLSLNDRIGGGVLPGHHIVLVAYPETGKTMEVITMMAGFVNQGLKVLYVGNEDPIKAVIARFVSCLTGIPTPEVQLNPHRAVALASKAGYKNAVFAGLSGGTVEDIRTLLNKHQPQVLIVDQIRNISSKAENRTLQLETVARAMRNFAREFDLVSVSVTQGADSARGKLILDMGDVDGSNVGIHGTADIMLMIGMNQSYDEGGQRQFTLAKNKVGGLHDSWPVNIRPDISRVINVG